VPHRWNRCKHDWGWTNPLAQIVYQLDQVAIPTSGRVELQHIIDTEREHTTINWPAWNRRKQPLSCNIHSCANFPHCIPMHRPFCSVCQGTGDLACEGACVIWGANPCNGGLTDD
jgi:hypothetical protein